MQAKLIRDDLEIPKGHPGVSQDFFQKNCAVKTVKRNGRMRHVMFWKEGTMFSTPDCYKLVRQGAALPIDDECREAAGMDAEQMASAQRAYERLSAGIDPEDFELYDAGVIVGYNPDGSFKPGPNFHLLEQAAEDAAEIDDTPLTGGTT